jgi:RNA polymerase sigma factor for flagellar operon FliA
MVDLLRSASPEPRGARARRRRIEDAEARLAARLGRAPSAGELAEALGMAVDELHRARGDAVHLASIDDCYSESDLAFAAEETNAEAALLQHEDREQLIEAIGSLPERQQLVVQLYFVEELNLAEIAMVLGVSVPRVHQLKAAALDKLRLAFAAED